MYPDQNHTRRINRVLNHVQSNYPHEIDLGSLADVACLSKFHFLRVFQNNLRETPVSFVQRIRLERAARNLVYMPHKRIIDVAFDCGFNHASSFTSAFKHRFHVPPSVFQSENEFHFRAYWQFSSLADVPGQDPARKYDPQSRLGEVRVERCPPSRVAYIRRIGSYRNYPAMCRLFGSLREWCRRKGVDLRNTRFIGIPWDNPNITAPEQCRYDVCVPAADGLAGDDVVSVQIIPGGTYAVMPVVEEAMNLKYAWAVFGRYWLPGSRYTVGARAVYEVHELSQDGVQHHCRSLWLPLRSSP